MEISFKGSDVNAVVPRATAQLEKNPAHPILGHLLIEAKPEGVVTITAAHTALQFTVQMVAQVVEAGELTVPADKFRQIVAGLKSRETITMKLKEGKCIIQSGRSRYRMETLDAKGYPKIEKLSAALGRITVPAWLLCNGLSAVAHSMADRHGAHASLAGCAMTLFQNELQLAATDGHRASIATLTPHTPIELLDKVATGTLPEKQVKQAISELKLAGDSNVTLQVLASQVVLSGTGWEWAFSLIAEPFPDIQRVIPATTNAKWFKVNKVEFINAIKRAQITADEKTQRIELKTKKNILTITSKSTNDESIEQLPVECSDELHIAFNASYLIDSINADNSLSNEDGSIELYHCDKSPLRIGSQLKQVQVVMPLRL